MPGFKSAWWRAQTLIHYHPRQVQPESFRQALHAHGERRQLEAGDLDGGAEASGSQHRATDVPVRAERVD